MQSILFRHSPADETLIADLWETGTQGIVEEANGFRAFFDDSTDLHPLIDRYPDAFSSVRREENPNPEHFERGDWEPVVVGERFFIVPSWLDAETPPGRLRLTVDASTAFGTGRHESTQVMLEVMEQYVRPGHAIVDVGTGSGILSAAAAMLGAGRVFSCDIDEQAVLSAREHIDTPVFRGSADSVRSDVADLVLANISAIVIDALASDLNRIAKDDGSLLLAGFLSDNRPKRFVPEQEFERDGWLCWLCRPSRVMAQFGGASPLYHAERWW